MLNKGLPVSGTDMHKNSVVGLDVVVDDVAAFLSAGHKHTFKKSNIDGFFMECIAFVFFLVVPVFGSSSM
jgi:hypothetical protein